MANALGPAGINVNAVYPGGTVTEMTFERYQERAQREGKTVEALMSQQAEATLIRHLITAEDLANVVAFLCSPLAVGITGEAIAVNGGSSADMHY
jgi:NAD(P)-dependent dehydrogenase (short-subunit alcohol dehydrogenase family)